MSAGSDRLVRLVDAGRILSRSDGDGIASRVFAFARGGGETRIDLQSWWQGELRWGRNRVALSSDRRDVALDVFRYVNGILGKASTNQLDDASLEAAVRAAERNAALFGQPGHPPDVQPPIPRLERPQTAIWSDASYALSTDARSEIATAMMKQAETKGLSAAGYLETRAASAVRVSSRA